ncbi:PQQ-dependent sugar dehydrogenase [Amphritea balenae]|uniref:Sorbosone dehydrogenase family protein n=1 Tax=Amphritea balenae TaxID=452629 RepID=A0A3P1SPI0_9GAMM|nr:PQQ-dependent sugar dehydrogenase [Amphritea balenae]RRC98874.1 sorbosone dehydrogenase family protein [Amphritea balenae]GGK62471.1 sorbosone dehydrogenase [Amphritea balenae]
MRALFLLAGLCISSITQALPLERLNLPDGYSIAVVAQPDNARQMALGEPGTLYVGSRREGKVYRLKDSDGDGIYEQQQTLMRRLNMPTGVAYRDGTLYVAAVNRILMVADAELRSDLPVKGQLLTDDLPDANHHGWKYLKFAPDGKLYFNLGAPCNTCLSEDPRFASILSLDPETGQQQIIARGVRNSVGFTWQPETGEFWFTDNGRDHLGDDLPDDELNRLDKTGQHFGYPYIHAGNIPDPDYYDNQTYDQYPAPVLKLGAHVAPLGLTFYTGKQFAQTGSQHLFIAEHGSWNRSKKVGYRIIRVDTSLTPVKSEVFIDGWLTGEKAWGRPVDVVTDRDGSLLISDDKAGVIYRISYKE